MNYILFISLTILSTSLYSPEKAVAYSEKHWNNPNHDCNSENTACTPYAYYGTEHCNYPDQGYLSNNGANFISQCLLEGGQNPLYQVSSLFCAKFHCGAIDVIPRLTMCLITSHKWKRIASDVPPKELKIGDIVAFHKTYTGDWLTKIGIVVEVSPKVKVNMNSPEAYHLDYDKVEGYKNYEWILAPVDEIKK